MITTAKFLTLLRYNDVELDKAVKSISEKDARDFIKFTVKFLRGRNDVITSHELSEDTK